MEGIILIIIIGLISKYFSKIKEYSEEKGLGQPGMPPFPKSRPIFDNEIEEYEYEMYDNTTKTKIVEMEREDHLPLDNNQNASNSNNTSNMQGSKLQEISTDGREDYLEDLFHIENVKRGVIWQEILEEPRARRPYRRL